MVYSLLSAAAPLFKSCLAEHGRYEGQDGNTRPSLPDHHICVTMLESVWSFALINHSTHLPKSTRHQAPFGRGPAITQLLRRLSFPGDGCWTGVECLHEVSWHSRASISTMAECRTLQRQSAARSHLVPSPLPLVFFPFLTAQASGFLSLQSSVFHNAQEALRRAGGENTCLCNVIWRCSFNSLA